MFPCDVWIIDSVAILYGSYPFIDKVVGVVAESPITNHLFPILLLLLWGSGFFAHFVKNVEPDSWPSSLFACWRSRLAGCLR